MKRKPLTALWEAIGLNFGRKQTAIHATAEPLPVVSVGAITIVWTDGGCFPVPDTTYTGGIHWVPFELNESAVYQIKK